MGLLQPGIGLLFWTTVIFAIVLFILGKWGWPVIIKEIRKREEYISNALSSAEKARKQVEQLQADNERLLLQAKDERDKILSEAGKVKDKILEEARLAAEKESEKILSRTKETILMEKNRAIEDLRKQVASFSIEIAQKILQEELSNKERNEQIISKEMEKMNFK